MSPFSGYNILEVVAWDSARDCHQCRVIETAQHDLDHLVGISDGWLYVDLSAAIEVSPNNSILPEIPGHDNKERLVGKRVKTSRVFPYVSLANEFCIVS